jgi:hypothetical protein
MGVATVAAVAAVATVATVATPIFLPEGTSCRGCHNNFWTDWTD